MDINGLSMRVLPISVVQEDFEEYVDAVSRSMDRIMIVKDDGVAAVLIGSDEWDALQETVQRLSQQAVESVAESEG